MFNAKALWWTILSGWILASVYWYVCKIKLLCDELANTRLLPTKVVDPVESDPASNYLSNTFGYPTSTDALVQYAVMLLGALLLGFFTGKSYEDRKTRELRYKLNRINRELKYFEPRK
jgi:hypothetical protein